MLPIGTSLLLLLSYCPDDPLQVEATHAKLRLDVINADSPQNAGMAFRKYFRAVSPNGHWLSYYLKHDLNTSISLQAEWQQRVVSRPAWTETQPRNWHLKPAYAQRFFGFLEGRTGLTIPDWWQGDGDFPGNVESIAEEEIEPLEPPPAGKWQVKLRDGESAETVAGGVRFADGEHSAVVKDDILESLREGYH